MLDTDSLKLVRKIAKDKDTQIWCERVGQGKECKFIIEDGKVKK